jgi:acyl-CoA synthetase (AMP-forming)/AMP-acid ligase II
MPRLHHGWFRTGDQGVMDADGYCHLTGRLKEIINRGGEKCQPARGRRGPDGPSGGGAGGDLRDAARQAGRGCRRGRGAARGRCTPAHRKRAARVRGQALADFKVPRKVLFLPEIPKGATGKLQRIGLARSSAWV